MSVGVAFLVGFIVGFLFMGILGMNSLNNKLKSGHIHDSEYNWYRVEKEVR